MAPFAVNGDKANALNLKDKWLGPSIQYPMGTDAVGRDVLARTVYGGQISLAIAVLSVTITTTPRAQHEPVAPG